MNQNQNRQYLVHLKQLFCFCLCFLTTFISFATELSTPSVVSSNLILWGKVVDPQGKVVSGANVEWVPMFQFDNVTSSLSDAGGNVFCSEPQLRKKDDFLICRHPLFATWGECHVKSKSFKPEQLYEIKLSTGSPLNLSIQSEDKKALAGANIFIERALSSNDDAHDYPNFEKLVSDAKGLATLNQFPTGLTKLLIQKTGYVYPRKYKLEHTEKKEFHVITLQKAKDFQFLVNYPTKQIAKEVKIIYAFSDNKITDFSSLKEDYLTLEDSDEAARKLQVPLRGYLSFKTNSKNYRELNVNNIELSKVNSASITLESLKFIGGKVVDAAGGKPLENANINIRYTKPNQTYDAYQSTTSKKDGRFQVNLDSVGEVELTVWHQDFLMYQKVYSADMPLDDLQLALDLGESMAFRLLQPLPFSEPAVIALKIFKVQLFTAHDKNFTLSQKSDQDGLCRISGLQKGDELEFRLEGYLWKKIKVHFDGIVEDILFNTSAKAEIQVVDEKDEALSNVQFYLSSEQQNNIPSSYDKTKKCYTLQTLPEGKVHLRVYKHKYLDGQLEFETQIGVLAQQKITLHQKPVYSVSFKNFEGIAPTKVELRFSSENRSSTRTADWVKSSQPPRYEWLIEDDETNYDNLQVNAEGYIPTKLPFDTKTLHYEVELQKGLALEALVQDASGMPVEGTTVAYSCPEFISNASAKSNAEGKVTLKGLIHSVYNVDLKKQGYASQKLSLDLTQNFPSPTWILQKGGTLQVTVFNSKGLPAEGLKVSLQKATDWGGYQPSESGRNDKKKTNPQGVIIFEGLDSGSYRAGVKDDNQGVGVSEDCVFKQDENLTTQITLLEGLKLSGKILSEDQKPISKVQVYAHSVTNSGGEQSQGNSDEEGNFSLKGLKKGLYQISLSHSDYESVASEMQYEAGQEDLNLVMRQSKTISVIIKTPDHSAPQKLQLYTRPEIYKYENQIYEVKSLDGKYQFKTNQLQLGGQSFRLIAKANGFNPGESEIFSLESLPEELEISLQDEKSIQFNIINTLGEALMGVKVSPRAMEQGMFGGSQNLGSATSDAKGLAAIKGLTEGEYCFEFKHNSYAVLLQTFKISSQDTLPHNITLSRGAILKGVVKDSQGELLKAASIWIQMKKDSSESITHIYSPLSTSSDDSGRYIIQSIPAGEGQVFFSRRGNFRNNASQKPNVVTFIEGDTVLLDLTEPEIENAGRLEVLLSEHWNDIFNNAHLTKTQIGSPMSFSALKSKSAFVFEKVPEGTYQLQLWSAIGKFKNREVSITANQTTTLQIDEEENFTVIAKVIDAAGKPIPMGHAMLVPADAANNFMSNPYKGMGGAGKIRNGQLQISLEQPGAFKLMLMIQSGMQMRTVTLDTINIQNEGVTDLGTITIKDGGQIQGMTLQSSGEPLANVQLLILKDGLPHFNPLWLSDKNGQFLLNDVPEPPFQLIATHPTMANLTTEVNDLSALRLVMTTGVNVTVQLNGINSANRRVILVHEDLSPLISLTHYQTMSNTSDKGGKIALSKISMGQYKVCVLGEKPEQNQYSDTFTVTNADITVQMTLQN